MVPLDCKLLESFGSSRRPARVESQRRGSLVLPVVEHLPCAVARAFVDSLLQLRSAGGGEETFLRPMMLCGATDFDIV